MKEHPLIISINESIEEFPEYPEKNIVEFPGKISFRG